MERYGIELHTIFGPRKGTLCLEQDPEKAVHGEVELLGRHNPVQGHWLDAMSMLLFGELQGLYHPLAYTMNCEVQENLIRGELTTPLGKMKISGQKMAEGKENKQ